ncbi:hypothetical protein F442_21115, partial [Phytophthora nicotianae P10297]
MLSCKTFLKLFAVAVALSDFTAHADSTHVADCEMIYDVVTPAPTVPVTPCPKPEGQDFIPTDVEGQSTMQQDNSVTTGTTPSNGYNSSSDGSLVSVGDVSDASGERPSTENGDIPAPNGVDSTNSVPSDTGVVDAPQDDQNGYLHSGGETENNASTSTGKADGADVGVNVDETVDSNPNSGSNVDANVGAYVGTNVGANVDAGVDANADANAGANISANVDTGVNADVNA